jgi:hypothetical protein
MVRLIDYGPNSLYLEKEAVHAYRKVLKEVDDNSALIVGDM